MHAHDEHYHEYARTLRTQLSRRYDEICSRYLPVAADDSLWRLSRAVSPGDPEQGWKLHVSATILTACAVLEKISSALCIRGTLFKAPASLLEVQRLNTGLHYGYSQVGKFITIYPETPEEAVNIARQLDQLLCRAPAPAVPFDLKFSPDGCVYYRYGAFKRREIENPDGTRTPAIRDPTGRLVPDLRDAEEAKPGWIENPFAATAAATQAGTGDSPLKTTYRAFRALAQRGRGGVYEAVDVSATPPRLCILKEGRREGEMSWDGRDGSWRVKNEERVLLSLSAAGIDAPQVYASFTVDGNYYLVTELIEGENLQAYLLRRRRRLSLARALQLGVRLSLLLARIHAAGWAWRDCKPANVMLTKAGALRPLDFEGACPVSCPDPMPWGTPGFTPPRRRLAAESRVSEDLYALGTTLHLLLTGELPNAFSVPIKRLRRNAPSEACCLIRELLTAEPPRQPLAQDAAQRLQALLPVTRRSRTYEGGSGERLRRRASAAKRGSGRRSSKAGSTVR